MKRKFISVIALFCIVLNFGNIASLASSQSIPEQTSEDIVSLEESEEFLALRLTDEAGLLKTGEESALLQKLDSLSEENMFDIVIVTNEHLNGKSAALFANDWFDDNGFGFGEERDGILLLLNMETREWAISTSGSGGYTFTHEAQSYIVDNMISYLSAGDYYSAFSEFADSVVYVLENPEMFLSESEFDDTVSSYDEGIPARYFFIPILIAVISGFVGVGFLKKEHITVEPARAANVYANENSFRLTKQNDMFLFRNITRTRRPKPSDNSSGSSGGRSYSSSGRSHGGSSGHF